MEDRLEIRPLESPPDARITVPGSKSYTNRALLIAALAGGDSILRCALFSDDTLHMEDSLRRLGIGVRSDARAQTFEVSGQGGRIPVRDADLFIGNAGTAMRFLTAMVALGRGRYRIDGIPRMRQRPVQDLLSALHRLGVRADSENDDGCPPVVVQANGLPGGKTAIPGNKSSQYLSALLMAAPYAAEEVEIEVLGELVAKPYIDITLSIMETFGAEVSRDGYRRFRIPAGQVYRALDYTVEPDASNASYFFAAAALTGGRVRVDGISMASVQGDIQFVDILERMGCQVVRGTDHVIVQGPERLRGVDADFGPISDTMQTLSAIAPFAEGETVIRNIGHTRLQETDRIHAVATELRRLGVEVEEGDDHLRISPGPVRPADIETYDDHRMAMSFALVGLRTPGCVILNPGCCSKTFPDYFERLERLRGGPAADASWAASR